jgi:hypothetical protein
MSDSTTTASVDNDCDTETISVQSPRKRQKLTSSTSPSSRQLGCSDGDQDSVVALPASAENPNSDADSVLPVLKPPPPLPLPLSFASSSLWIKDCYDSACNKADEIAKQKELERLQAVADAPPIAPSAIDVAEIKIAALIYDAMEKCYQEWERGDYENNAPVQFDVEIDLDIWPQCSHFEHMLAVRIHDAYKPDSDISDLRVSQNGWFSGAPWPNAVTLSIELCDNTYGDAFLGRVRTIEASYSVNTPGDVE